MRRDSREAVYKILFANLFNSDTDDSFNEFIFDDCNLNEKDREFAIRLLDIINAHVSELEEIISRLSKGYKLERIYSTDKCALLLALAEINYCDDIPSVVSIDEALSLVKKYSTEDSLKFVNGILAAYKKERD